MLQPSKLWLPVAQFPVAWCSAPQLPVRGFLCRGVLVRGFLYPCHLRHCYQRSASCVAASCLAASCAALPKLWLPCSSASCPAASCPAASCAVTSWPKSACAPDDLPDAQASRLYSLRSSSRFSSISAATSSGPAGAPSAQCQSCIALAAQMPKKRRKKDAMLCRVPDIEDQHIVYS